MRLFAGFIFVLVAIASVQSRPAISQLNNLNAAIASLPSLQNLKNQLNDVFVQLSSALSPAQLQSLQQQAFQLAQDVFDRKVDVSAAVNQLLQQLQQQLGSNSQLLHNVQPLIQQLVDAVRSVLQSLSSNVGTRSLSIGGTDIFALANEFGIHTLDDVIAVFPQYEDLIYQLVNAADQITSALSQPQLDALEQQAYGLAQNVFDRKVDVSEAVNVLFQQLQEYLGSSSQLLNSVQPLIPRLVDGVRFVLSLLPSNVQTRSLSIGGTDVFALANEFGIHTLDDVVAVFPQYEDLIYQLVNAADQITSALSQPQLDALEQQAYGLAQNVFDRKVDVSEAVNVLFQQLQEYLGSSSQLLNSVQPLIPQLVDGVRFVLSLLPSNISKQ